MLVIFVAVFAALLVHPVRTVKAYGGCSERTLHGNYGLVAPGMQDSWDRSFSMLATFDGKGGFTGSSFYQDGNGLNYGHSSFTTGSYTVNSDCTCILTVPIEFPFSVALTLNGIVVDTGGDEVDGTWYDAADNVSGSFKIKKVAVDDHHGCSDRTLSGNYGLVGRGIHDGEWDRSFSMLATFNGKGGFSGSSFYIDDLGTPSGPYTFATGTSTTGGWYVVNQDCTCTLIIPTESPFTYLVVLHGIVVDMGGDEASGTWFGNVSSDHSSGTFQIKKLPDLDEH